MRRGSCPRSDSGSSWLSGEGPSSKQAETAGVGGPGSYLWPWVAFMWSRMLMACLRSPSTLRK